jgi:hypothetical protein
MNIHEANQQKGRIAQFDRITALRADRLAALAAFKAFTGNTSQVKPAAVIRIYDRQSNFVDIKESGLSDYEVRQLLEGAIQKKIGELTAALAAV